MFQESGNFLSGWEAKRNRSSEGLKSRVLPRPISSRMVSFGLSLNFGGTARIVIFGHKFGREWLWKCCVSSFTASIHYLRSSSCVNMILNLYGEYEPSLFLILDIWLGLILAI